MENKVLTRVDDGESVDLRCSMMLLRGDHVLLCRRTESEDRWVLPGGTPRRGEGTATAAMREVAEETGLEVFAERVVFVLETSSWDRDHHLIEIVFSGREGSQRESPIQRERGLVPAFVGLSELDEVALQPPIGGYIRGFARSRRDTAAYLGNVWRPNGGSTDGDRPLGVGSVVGRKAGEGDPADRLDDQNGARLLVEDPVDRA